MKLLLVEDETLLGETIQSALIAAGYDTSWSAHGGEAHARLQQDKFDGVILDMGLPGMSGKEILRSLRHRGDQTPVLVYTARGDTDPADYQGADDFLFKNSRFTLALLIERVKRLLQQYAA